MGIINTKPSETGTLETPVLRNPLTDAFATIGFHEGTECEDMEMNMLDCYEAMGPVKGREYCKLYFQDFMECSRKWKQLHRVGDMRRERRKQWLKGLMGQGPRVPLSAGCPQHDGVGTEALNDTNK
ncbi:unnamed protein product [Allacma fusca]|uniref:NADH dehydrogenase [ubiquinone] iron-sulfur protein 5 n=1 Tax=Allacma fusca TaxID=39272 RepID=A0A8J2PKM2_9HEXA|nr:unnamed protein product [Allacma fusca]